MPCVGMRKREIFPITKLSMRPRGRLSAETFPPKKHAMRALEDYDGYNKYIVADSEETPHSTTDARIKEMLRAEPWYGLFLLVGVQVLMDHIDDLPDDDLCGMFDSVFSAELIRETVPLIYNRMNGFPDGHQCQ